MIIIGVKSKAQKRVGIYFLIFLYKGPRISWMNFGLKRSPKSISHESIISAITRYSISSKKITTARRKVVNIFYFLMSKV